MKSFFKFLLILSLKIIYFAFCAFITAFIIFGLMDFSNLSIIYVSSAISLLIFMWSMFFWKMKFYKKIFCITFLFFWIIIQLLFTGFPCAEMNICHQGMIRKNEKGESFKINAKTCTQNGYRWNAKTKFCDMNK